MYIVTGSFQNNVAVSRLSSVSSQDSGFMSQEQFFARPPSPLAEAEVFGSRYRLIPLL